MREEDSDRKRPSLQKAQRMGILKIGCGVALGRP